MAANRVYGDCGKLTDETYGFKDVDPVWRYDASFENKWRDPILGPFPGGSGFGPDDLPALR